MGCGITHSKSNRLSIFSTLSKSDINNSLHSNQTLQRRSLITHKSKTSFWGTSPYYVMSNRLTHLCNEVKSKFTFEKILVSIEEILKSLIEYFDGNLKEITIDTFGMMWIRKYENSDNLLKIFGLRYKRNQIKVLEGVSKSNISAKIKEIQYFSRRAKDSEYRNLTLS